MPDFKKLIHSPEYRFLWENEHLKERLMIVTLGGSHAYGTNIEGSDVDIRGVALNRPTDLLGLTRFEQVEDKATDTTIYSFNKLIGLLMNCNPNTIEMLGCKPEHYLVLSDEGRMLLENRKLFLSRKAVYSFGGYANQQLHRLQNALARGQTDAEEKEKHILQSCLHDMQSFPDRYTEIDSGALQLYVGNRKEGDDASEILMDVSLSGYPLRDFCGLWEELKKIAKDYDSLNNRNKKKDDAHLSKHMMHLVRLYLMCLDILEKEEIVTYREDEHDMLMDIRNGKYLRENGSVDPVFMEIIAEYEKRLEYAKENTSLPATPDYHKIQDLVMTVNRLSLKKEWPCEGAKYSLGEE